MRKRKGLYLDIFSKIIDLHVFATIPLFQETFEYSLGFPGMQIIFLNKKLWQKYSNRCSEKRNTWINYFHPMVSVKLFTSHLKLSKDQKAVLYNLLLKFMIERNYKKSFPWAIQYLLTTKTLSSNYIEYFEFLFWASNLGHKDIFSFLLNNFTYPPSILDMASQITQIK